VTNFDFIANLKDQSTCQLPGLGIITYGVYFAHYIKKQTVKINAELDGNNPISDGFVNVIMFMSYASLALLLVYLSIEEGHPWRGALIRLIAASGHFSSPCSTSTTKSIVF